MAGTLTWGCYGLKRHRWFDIRSDCGSPVLATFEHEVDHLPRQRVLGVTCGYEDLSDHNTLRDDPLFAAVVGETGPLGLNHRDKKDKGHPLARPSMLNRLELTPSRQRSPHCFVDKRRSFGARRLSSHRRAT